MADYDVLILGGGPGGYLAAERLGHRGLKAVSYTHLSDVRHHALGERVLVQTDYRHLPTASSNAAFGYNFEGALQEYVVLDLSLIHI